MNAIDYLNTPCGVLEITATDNGVTAVNFVQTIDKSIISNAITNNAKTQLNEYILGKRQRFDLPLTPSGSEFQKQVWQALMSIGYGETASYLDIAKEIGNIKACRAVGAANGRNPIGIIVPCHRVIGSNGKLTGYAGGLERKKWLLDLEQQA